jgi:type I restriction enzyme M protein
MLDQRRREVITSAVWKACEAFRGSIDPGETKDFVLAMLLLKYISDVGQARVGDSKGSTTLLDLVAPTGADFWALHRALRSAGNGPRINQALRAIEEANPKLLGVFRSADFDSTALGSMEQKDRVLGDLLAAFSADALDFRADPMEAAEAVAAACDALIRQVAEAGGKRGGEFFTPMAISQLLARLMQPKGGETVSDPCCGSGSLLIICSQQARQSSGGQGCTLYGQEKDGNTWALAKMNMVLHGETQHQLEWGDTLRNPKLLAADGTLRKSDVVVSSPPFSLRDWGHESAERDVHQRYWRGVPPRTAGDYAFISHMVETLSPGTGRMAAIVSLGVLFRGAADRQIREKLLGENLIDAVIALPAKMFPYTGIPVALLVLRKDKADDSVLFIDASRAYQHGKTQNVLRQADLDLIESTYRARQNVDRYARLATPGEITANDCNLNVARYVDATEDEVLVNLTMLRAERAEVKAELASLEAKLATLLEEIGHA